ncbi:MAG: hypothetical protein IPL65_21640 [Lewinellaceae bacterium]|nr:hypothetical protein [Lewinellaceae bacterium]
MQYCQNKVLHGLVLRRGWVLPVLVLYLISWSKVINAQNLPICQGGELPASSCASSCVVCDLNGYSNTTVQITPGSPPPGFCTQVVHNIGWIGFIAGSVDLSIDVEVFPCTLGNSIEMGIYEGPNCTSYNLVSNCNTAMFQNNIYSFNNTEPLVPGCIYFLVFDNNGPASCPFTVTVTSGSATAPQPAAPVPSGPTQVCPGATVTYTIPPVFGTCSYTWTAPAGSLINGAPGPASIQGDAGTTVDVTFGSSSGNVCVQVGNACAGNLQSCLPVTVAPIPPTILPPVSICNGDSYEWIDGNFYANSQVMSVAFSSWLGCDSVVNQQLIVRPAIITNLGTQLVCEGDCIEVGGANYCGSGFYQVTLSSWQNCDSNVVFSLLEFPANANIATPDTINCLQSSVLLDGTGSTSQSTFQWYNASGMLLGADPTQVVTAAGNYSLVIVKTGGNISCSDTATVMVLGDQQIPVVSIMTDTIGCNGIPVQIFGSSFPDSLSCFWTGPGIDTSNQNLLAPFVGLPGTYVFSATNPLTGCAAADSTTVIGLGPNPNLTISPDDTLDCNSPVIQLVASSSTPGSTLSWLAPNGTTFPSDTVNADLGGWWVATALGAGGCVTSDSLMLSFDTLQPMVTALGGELDCTGNPILLQGISNVGNALYSWAGPSGFLANVADTLTTVSGIYTLTVTAPNGCMAADTALVLANTNAPDLMVTGMDT